MVNYTIELQEVTMNMLQAMSKEEHISISQIIEEFVAGERRNERAE